MPRIRMSYSQSRELQDMLSDKERPAIRPATDGAGFELLSDDATVLMAAKLIGSSIEEEE